MSFQEYVFQLFAVTSSPSGLRWCTLRQRLRRRQGICMHRLHAGPTLVSSMLTRCFHNFCLRKAVRSITRQFVICRRQTTRPEPLMLGQLPIEGATPGTVFEKVGVDYAGSVHVKYGMVHKPNTVKAYTCIFVSLTVKAVHLEVVQS